MAGKWSWRLRGKLANLKMDSQILANKDASFGINFEILE
jgi:hypothetical protein